jgi:hypothetical protein
MERINGRQHVDTKHAGRNLYKTDPEAKSQDLLQWYICLGMALANEDVRQDIFSTLYLSAAPPGVQQMLKALKVQDRKAAMRAAEGLGFGDEQHSFVKGLIERLRVRHQQKQLRERLAQIGRMSLLVGDMDQEELLSKAKEVLDGGEL